jgi:hypothetical protein
MKTIDRLIESPLSVISAGVTLVLTLYGLWSMFADLNKSYGWLIASVASFFPVALIGVSVFLAFTWNRRRGYSVANTQRFLFTHVFQHWHIEQDGTRRIRCIKKYVFFEEPKEIDLSETLFGSLDLEYARLNYRTEDAIVKDIEQAKKTVYRINWNRKSPFSSPSPVFMSLLTLIQREQKLTISRLLWPLRLDRFWLTLSLQLKNRLSGPRPTRAALGTA